MSKREILKSLKLVHRAAQRAFDSDKAALTAARQRINEEYRKELEVDDDIGKKLKTANDVVMVLEKQVVQLVKNPTSDNFQMKLRKETNFEDNVIFQDDAVLPPPRTKKCK